MIITVTPMDNQPPSPPLNLSLTTDGEIAILYGQRGDSTKSPIIRISQSGVYLYTGVPAQFGLPIDGVGEVLLIE